MLSWLKKNGHELKASAEVEFAYQELVESLGQSEVNRLIPLQRNNRLKRIRKAQAEKANQQARAQAIQTQIMNLEQEVTAEIKQEFAELAQKASDICDQALIKLAVITEKQNSAYESTSKEIDKLERKIAITKVQTEQLEISISQTNEEIEKVYQEQLKLATSIDEVAKAIKKRKKKRQKNLTKTIIVVVGCIAGGAIVAQFFPGITILPSVEGNGISTMIRI